MARKLPSGTVTFLFTDIEGSTTLLRNLGADAYARALKEHRRVLRDSFGAHGGVEVDTQGDAFFVAFGSAAAGVAAARAAQLSLRSGPIRVRMGLHTGTPHLGEEGYVGEDVHLGARIAAAGHGGQVLLSQTTCTHVDGDLTDLGEHRLKDFSEPVWIFQLGSERFPPLKTISNTNLPRPASTFVGRKQEVREVTALLREDARLVTLSGPGGSGKTRLAIEAAAELVPDFRGGVFWIGLAPLHDPSLVTATIAQVLGAKDGLAEHVGERELLLLLDNIEQVIEAAPELAALVEACPGLRMLVTSRELMRVRGEVEYPVPPLVDDDAVELFCGRSRLQPDPSIGELCRKLDNLPLAVELAAARTSVLSPAQILDRLAQRLDLLRGGRDAEARQATLRATIAWSHDLLDADEQRLFARLAVFRGGSTLEATEAVCHADLDTLQSLVDKNLLRRTNDRFWMLETIREYAAEKLAASDEADDLGDQHAEYFVALAEAAQPYLWPRQSDEWYERLTSDHDNFRAVFERLTRTNRSQDVLALAGNLHAAWGGVLGEGRQLVEDALRTDERPTRARAKALLAAADMAMGQADDAAVKLRARQALELFRSFGDDWGAAYAQFAIGHALAEEEDFVGAKEAAEESARLWQAAGDDHGTMNANWLLAWTCRGIGEEDHAAALEEKALEQARTLGNREMLSLLLSGGRAHRAIDEGRAADAITMLEEAFEITRERGDLWRLTHVASGVAHALASLGHATEAVRVLASERELFRQIGGTPPGHLAKEDEKTLSLVHARLDDDAFDQAWRAGSKLSADEAIALALAASGLRSSASEGR